MQHSLNKMAILRYLVSVSLISLVFHEKGTIQIKISLAKIFLISVMPLCDCKFLATGNIFTELKNLIKVTVIFSINLQFFKGAVPAVQL